MVNIKKYILLLALTINVNLVFGQALTCADANILGVNYFCSLDELDGFSTTMPTNAENPFDGLPENPAPFCQGPGGNGSGNPQNMSWFGFVASGPTATMELLFSNCSGGLNGVQYGIYTDCTFSEFLPGACQGTGVTANNDYILNLAGMTAGDDYYFFIDGDNGTVCDYEINILDGGGPIPVPQPTEIICTSANCPPDGSICSTGETFTFEPVGLDLSIDYIWTVVPSPPVDQTITGDNSISLTFNNPGEYQICMTATNGCTTTDEICYTLNILEADAGILTTDPETLCPGGVSTVTATGYGDSPPIEHGLIAVGPDGVVIGVVTGDMIDVTYPSCGVVTVYSYNYNPADSPALPSVGDMYSEPSCSVTCCDTESIEVSFEDNEPPQLSNTPVNVTLECSDPIPNLDDVDWTDNCDGAGTVAGVQVDNFNICDGGTITRTWEYTDGCMNTIDYVQTITINAQMGGSFDQEPEDMTFDCEADIPAPIDLNWTGDCEGTAVITPVDGGDSDLCAGGIVTRTWSHTDACGGFTEYVQSFTINAANAGVFMDPPGDTDALCDQSDIAPIQDLTWVGDCEGTAQVVGTEDVDVNSCFGGTITRTWTFTDDCGELTEHTQIITVNPPPSATPINPPPTDITITCDEIPATFPILSFTNGQTGDCSIMGDADPEIVGDPTICGGSISVLWLYTDACFNVSSFVQNITILPAAAPEFENPPADMTVSCVEGIPTFQDLDYDNGETGTCAISGTESASTNIDGDICGGSIVGIWQIPDPCNPGGFIEHMQTITIEPITEPVWIDPPVTALTLQCSEMIPPAMDLAYTNSESGTCEIMGSVPPDVMGTTDVCGGEITYSWEFTDECGRLLEHQQIITVEPASAPEFVNPPADVTIGCDEIPPTPPSLDYSNGETGVCVISGSQAPTVDDNSNSCGGTITYTWQFTDPCNRPINYSQTVTITQAPIAVFIDPPAPTTVDCNNLPPAAGPLDYTNNDPCEIMGSVIPTIDNDFDICGGTITNTWEFTDECERLLSHSQIITVEPAPIASFIDVPANTTVACGSDATDPGNLSYNNGETGDCEIMGDVAPTQTGSYDACGGEILFTWEFEDQCMRIIQETQTVVVEPAPPAEFVNPPADITVSCADFETTPPNLSYTNGETDLCLISGDVPGVVIGNTSPCGVDVTYRWEFADDCGRNITYSQTVTIEEAVVATFVNPPGPITLDCDDVALSPPSLSYNNGASGICAIIGDTPGIQSGFYDECGGSLTYSWTFTDVCNRTITHSQDVTVNPAPDPVFLDLPADITLDCGEDFPEDPTLDFSNSLSGACGIANTVTATSNVIGNITSYTWEFTNDCNGNTITYTQNVTGVPTPEISIDPESTIICLGETFDLSTIAVTDINGNSLTITYQDQGGATISDPMVSPTVTTTYTIIAANDAGCTDNAIFVITVDEPAFAGMGGTGTVCGDNGLTFNLFDFLTGSFTPGGTWFDTDGTGVNLDDPINVNFGDVDAGVYTFTYTVFSSNSCPDAEATIELEVISELDFEILNIECAPGGATYTVTVLSNGNNIFSSLGDVVVVDANNVIVENIPADELVVISAIDPNAFCISNKFVNAPDCDCPDVASPISGGDLEICEGDDLPELSVTVEAGLMANWYDSQVSTTPLIENSLTYTPTMTGAGIYNFYVEAEAADGCVSLIRTLVILEIKAKPEATDINVPLCVDVDGNAIVDLQTLNLMINSNANFNFDYYASLGDAEDEMNELPDEYSTTTNSTLYVVVTNTSGCTDIAEVSIVANPLPSYTLTVLSEVCLDSMDGSIALSNVMPVGTEFSLDNVDFNDVSEFLDLGVGNYTLYSRSPDGCINEEDFMIGPGLEISYVELQLMCDDNDTNTDSTDDFYNITFTVSNNAGSTGNVTISSSAGSLGSFPYGEISVVIPSGGSEVITILDEGTGCQIQFNTGDLNSCSTSCSVSIDQLDTFCNGNGTDSDPNDDIWEISINASSVNGAANNSFNVTLDGAIVNNFQYGTGGVITIPAQGQSVVIGVVDNADDQCFATQSIGPLDPCSNACIISIDNQNFICNNNGTIGVPGDDVYDFSFTVLSINSTTTTYKLFVDGVEVGTYNYGELSIYSIPADGDTHIILFEDSDNPDCNVEITSPELTTCSGTCTVNTVIQDVTCDNIETADDELDDTYSAEVFITTVGGSGSWTIAQTGQSGTSGETITIGPFLITDGNTTILIEDASLEGCSITIELIAPSPCSSCEESVEAGADWALDCAIVDADLIGVPSSTIVGTWTGPGGFMSLGDEVTVDVPGTYYYTVDFGEGCIRTDSLVVSVSNEIPVASGGENQEITCITDMVTLTGSVVGGSGNFTYQWLDATMTEISTDISIEVTVAGNYFFVVYDFDSDCFSPPSLVEVVENTDDLDPTIMPDPSTTLDCVVEVITLTTPEQPNVVYEWYINSVLITGATVNITITDEANIILQAIDTITGCTGMDDLFIANLEEYPIINLMAPPVLDCINGSVTIDGSGSQSGSNIVYTWIDEMNNIIATGPDMLEVTEGGEYYLQLVDVDNNCSNIDTIVVDSNIDLPEVQLDESLTINCDATELNVALTTVLDPSDLNILWTSQDGNIVSGEMTTDITVSSEGTYIVSVINPLNQCETLDTVLVSLPEQIEDSQFTISDESCEESNNGEIIIDMVQGGTAPYVYFLDNVEFDNDRIGDLDAGTYTLQVVDDNGCEFEAQLTIGIQEEFEITLLSEITITLGQTSQLFASVNIPDSEIANVVWSPSTGLSCSDCLAPTLTSAGTGDTEYTVGITDIYGCYSEATITVRSNDEVIITVPNVMNVNSPGGNENFTIYSSIDAMVNKLTVFDRWGNMMFIKENFPTNDPAEGWNGKYDKTDVVQGVYVYIAEILIDGDLVNRSGDITVLR